MVHPVSRRRVLFIEDEPALRLSYERAFAQRYDAAYAATGAEAMTLLAQHHPDVACSTCAFRTPTASICCAGFATGGPILAVIITSAYVSLEPQLAVLAIPHNGYLVKPFDLAELPVASTMPADGPLVEARGLTRSYGAVLALRGIDLTLSAEMFCWCSAPMAPERPPCSGPWPDCCGRRPDGHGAWPPPEWVTIPRPAVPSACCRTSRCSMMNSP